jgi:hypothetical protein
VSNSLISVSFNVIIKFTMTKPIKVEIK